MAETLVLDPVEVADGRTEFDLTPFVGAAGPDYGDAEIDAYLADAARGSLPVDFRVPNRIVTVPLVALERGGLTFEEVRRIIQAKAALFQREGGWVKRETAAGTVYADVLKASLKLGGSSLQAWGLVDADAALTLECLPDWYGDEEDLGAIPSASGELVFTLPGVRGDYPARTRLVVTDGSGKPQRGLLWGLRSRHYDAAATAKLSYQAEALTALGAAASVTVNGQTVIRRTSLSTSWTPVLSTQLSGGGHMTHTGSYRVWARATPSVTRARLRLLWDVGDLVAPVVNDAVTLPQSYDFTLVDLGTVRLDAAPIGTHRWQGVIQAVGAVDGAGSMVSIDRLWLVPVDEGYGELSAPAVSGEGPWLSAYTARDEFDQTAAALDGAPLVIGGSWATSGDSDDFNITGSGSVRRTAVSDTAGTGRYAIAGTSVLTDTLVQVDVAATTNAAKQAVLARYTNASNFLKAYVTWNNPGGDTVLLASVEKNVAGTKTLIGSLAFTAAPQANSATLRLVVDGAGNWAFYVYQAGRQPDGAVLVGSDTDLATGGALASGKLGMYDEQSAAPPNTRTYDNFVAYAPTFDAVINASMAAELRTDGMFRQSADGNGYGQVSHVIGDLPRLPAAGMEGRVCEVILKPSRGEPGVDADPALDAISAHVYCRPSWLFVPAT